MVGIIDEGNLRKAVLWMGGPLAALWIWELMRVNLACNSMASAWVFSGFSFALHGCHKSNIPPFFFLSLTLAHSSRTSKHVYLT
jgi:hypothetical protein